MWCVWGESLLQHAGFFSCGVQTPSCGTWDLVPGPGIRSRSPVLGGWSVSHWATREVTPWKILEQWNRSIKKVSFLLTPALPHSWLICTPTLNHTRMFLFSTSGCPFFVLYASEGKLCQHSALLTRDSHLLVTKGYSKNMIPLWTALFPAAVSQENTLARGDCPHLCRWPRSSFVCLLITTVWVFADILMLSQDAAWGGGWCPGYRSHSAVSTRGKQRPGLELGQIAVIR